MDDKWLVGVDLGGTTIKWPLLIIMEKSFTSGKLIRM